MSVSAYFVVPAALGSLLLGVVCAPLAGQTAAARSSVSSARVQHVSVSGTGEAAEVEIQTLGVSHAPNTQVITGPDRIIVDFPGALPAAELRALAIKLNSGALRGVRAGLFFNNPPITRVVLDLAEPRSYQISTSDNKTIVKLGPAKAELGKLDSGKVEAAKADSLKQDSPKQDLAKSDPPKPDSAKHDPFKPDPALPVVSTVVAPKHDPENLMIAPAFKVESPPPAANSKSRGTIDILTAAQIAPAAIAMSPVAISPVATVPVASPAPISVAAPAPGSMSGSTSGSISGSAPGSMPGSVPGSTPGSMPAPLSSQALIPPAMPATPPVTVTFINGMLSIAADKATMAQVLFEVHQRTHAEIAIPAGAEQEQVISNLGPGPAREVLAALLNGSPYNFIFVGDENTLERVILTRRDPDIF